MNRPRKAQPLRRTVVTEFKVVVADLHLRRKAMGGSIAKAVSMETDFISGDAVCSAERPFSITDIRTAVMLHSFNELMVSITIGGITTPFTKCHGLFVFYGEIERVDVQAVSAEERFVYVRS